MKDLVKRMKSFITFDFQLQVTCISTLFARTHARFQTEFPDWSTTATRQQLISNYWFTYVTGHFFAILSFPAFIVFFMQGFANLNIYLISVLIGGLISFPVLYLFHYKPYFSSLFLPRLETIKESFDNKQLERFEKCKKGQLSNFALTLVYYALDKSSKINSLQCNEHSAKLLARLYGVDPGSLKKNLTLIFGNRKPLTLRKSTELRNQFEEAFSFFEEMKFTEGVACIKQLEQKLLSNI